VARRRQHVLQSNLVRARDLYGYYESEEPFLRITLINPRDVARASALLQAGAVFGTRFLTYEVI
jgi:hypothetical protein